MSTRTTSRRPGVARTAPVIVALALLAAACGGGSDGGTGGTAAPTPAASRQCRQTAHGEKCRNHGGGSGGQTGSPAPVVSPPSISPQPLSPDALPLGALQLTSGNPDCAAGQECRIEMQITCPGVKETDPGVVDIRAADGPPKGLVAFFSAGHGTTPWGDNAPGSSVSTFFSGLQQQGLTVVQVWWRIPWLRAAPGEQAGPARLACRPATAIKWLHDNVYAKMGVPSHAVGVCGFCVEGDSGGASQVAYALSHYGEDAIIDGAFMAGGPPHAGLAAGCLRNQSQSADWYTNFSMPIIDESYGYIDTKGPCQTHDASFVSRWNQDGIDSGGSDYSYPNTRVVVMKGASDGSEGPPHGQFFVARLQQAKDPRLSQMTVAGAGHLMSRAQSGLDALEKLFLAGR